jgi:hypothetical protein
MVKTLVLFFNIILIISGIFTLPALAQSEPSGVTVHESDRYYPGDEMLGIKPAVGTITYNDSSGGRSTRASYGLQGEYNLANAVGANFERWFMGPQTGFMFSHLGEADSNFFGADSASSTGQGGSNFLMIPVNLKVAYAPVKWMRVGVHGGGNVMYRSVPASIGLDNSDVSWRMIPNVGGDVEFSVSKDVALAFRPDWTLSPTQSVFSTSFALGIALG